MKSSIKYLILSLTYVWYGLVSKAYASIEAGIEKIDPSIKATDKPIDEFISLIVANILGIFYFVAVLFAIYGGFLIFSSLGDDEKVSKGKNIIVYALAGLLVIFIASSLVTWFVDTVLVDAAEE